MSDLLTMAEIARQLNLPESTVRYYRDRFPEFVPAVGDGRGRRYRPEALDVLQTIADAMREGTPAEDVAAALARQYPITSIDRSNPQQQDRNQPQPTAAARKAIAELIADMVANAENALLEVAAETAALRNQQQELIAETAALRNEVRSQPQQTAAAIDDVDRRHEVALRRLCEQQEQQMQELRAWLESRLPPTEAKRLGLVARIRAMLGRDRHG